MGPVLVLSSAKLAGGLTALGVIALVLAIAGLYYISRDRELSGSTKTMSASSSSASVLPDFGVRSSRTGALATFCRLRCGADCGLTAYAKPTVD